MLQLNHFVFRLEAVLMDITALWALDILFHSHVNQDSSGMNLMDMVEVPV